MSAAFNIKAAFETVLLNWANSQSPALPIRWQRFSQDRPASTYLRASMIVAPMQHPSLGGSHERRTGIFQVDVVGVDGVGTGVVDEIADSIVTLYKVGMTLSHGGTSLVIERQLGPGPVIDDEKGYIFVPVSTEWRCDLF